MKHKRITVLILLVVGVACAPAPTATRSALATATSIALATATATTAMTETATATDTNTPTETATATLTSTPTNTPLPTNTATPRPMTLRDLADRAGIKFGVALEANLDFYKNQIWKEVVAREFNAAVITIAWQVMMLGEGAIDFNIPDTQIRFASSNGMELIGHHLVYPWYLPDWLKRGSFTREQLISIMRSNIQSIMTRYKGRVAKWSVVNESVINTGSTEFFYQHIGSDYIQIAFQAAREADPSAMLYYNDFGDETVKGPKYQQTKQIIDSLKTKGLIDGVGLQLHIDALQSPSRPNEFAIKAGSTPYFATPVELIEGMRSYGLPVYITELDVDLRNVSGTDEHRFVLQADIYKNVTEAALESGVCKSIVFWGIGDKYSWLEQPEFNGSPKAQPTLFDDSLNPKPAYFAVRDVLLQYAQK